MRDVYRTKMIVMPACYQWSPPFSCFIKQLSQCYNTVIPLVTPNHAAPTFSHRLRRSVMSDLNVLGTALDIYFKVLGADLHLYIAGRGSLKTNKVRISIFFSSGMEQKA